MLIFKLSIEINSRKASPLDGTAIQTSNTEQSSHMGGKSVAGDKKETSTTELSLLPLDFV
jgi:hypothetical protein